METEVTTAERGTEAEPSLTADSSRQYFPVVIDSDEFLSNVNFHEIQEVVIGSSCNDTNVAFPNSRLQQKHDVVRSEQDMMLIFQHVDEVIENVIETNAVMIDPESSQGTLSDTTLKKRQRRNDSAPLPFQYAGQIFNEQSQKLILNVLHFLQSHQNDTYLEGRIRTPEEKAARVLNVSASVIKKLRNNWKRGILEQAALKRKVKKRILDTVSDDDESAIRNIIHQMNLQRMPTYIPSILAATRQRINFVGSRTSFRRILKRMGFTYGKIGKKLMLVESSTAPAVNTSPPPDGRIESKLPCPGSGSAHQRNKRLSSAKLRRKPQGTHNALPGRNDDRISQVSPAALEDRHADQAAISPSEETRRIEPPQMSVVRQTHSTSDTLLLPSLSNFLIDHDSSMLVPGEYVFELDGENLCFRLARPDSLVDSGRMLPEDNMRRSV